MNTHAVERTSPKGTPFRGTCFKCGATDLPMTAVSEPCENPANLTDDEALLAAVRGPRDSGSHAQHEDPERG